MLRRYGAFDNQIIEEVTQADMAPEPASGVSLRKPAPISFTNLIRCAHEGKYSLSRQ